MTGAGRRARSWPAPPSGVDPRATVRMAVYAVIGVGVGIVVCALEWITVHGGLDRLTEMPLWFQAAGPGIGLVLAALILGRRVTAATSEEYVRVFHSGADLPLRDLPRKFGAAVATLGLGGAGGLEGPSVFLGATIGQRGASRFEGILGPRAHRAMTAAGAAAGVAAIFQAPATGVLFALETPFQRDVARRALIPALIAASSAYLTYVTIFGVDSFLPVPSGRVRLRDQVVGALVLGVVAGITARALAFVWSEAKSLGNRVPRPARIVLGASIGALCLAGARGLTGESFTLGPASEEITRIALDPDNALWVIAGAFALRTMATAATLGAGGVSGLFIPLAVQGLLVGRLVGSVFDAPSEALYPVIGLAAVLGAGYRTPLAAVMFVAETTGRAEFVIPALLATAVSQSVMGTASVSAHQVTEREGLLERRLRMPVGEVMMTVPVLEPTMPITEIIDSYGSRPPAQALPVADTGYRGLLVLRDLAAAMFEHGPEATAADVMQDVAPVAVDAPAVEAARLMGEHDTAILAVVDRAGRAIGVVTALTVTGVLDYDPDTD